MSRKVRMLDTLYSVCAAIAGGVQLVTDALKYIVHLNYEVVSSVVGAISGFVTLIISICTQIKLFFVLIVTCVSDFAFEIQSFFVTIFTIMWKSVVYIYEFAQACYMDFTSVCLTVFCGISSVLLTIRDFVMHTSNFLWTAADYSVGAVVSGITTVFITITALGTYCVNFVTGVWQGLGFVLSSVASFPSNCVQGIKDLWLKCIDSVVNVLTATTKETYLGIVVLCLVYLTLSNTLRYLYCRGMSLFPRRLRARRSRNNNFYWQFDRGFESDFEDMYGSDTEDRMWVNNTRHNNADTDDEDTDNGGEDENDNSDSSDDTVSDDDDDDNDTDEYTVVTEDSDSDESLNSQTFSTESSDHEIEVQLPPVDERYSLRSRSSTPSRAPKFMNSPEEFDREMERERDKRKCVVCQDQIKSVLVLPCRHMCMCVLCADQIVRSRTMGRRVCPLCRTRITKVMNIYV